MKTLNEIIKQVPVYLNDWSHKIDVIGDFEDIYMDYKEYIAKESPYANNKYWLEKKQDMDKAIKKYENVNILFASYSYANYEGDAWVLFEQNGELYEVNGGHCSCYGLEGQWSPDKVSLKELEHRLTKGAWGEDDWSDNNFKKELCEFLGIEYVENVDKW